MNTLIKQLWTQAGGSFSRGNQHDWPSATIQDPEAFAKLIMQECAEALAKVPGGTDSAIWYKNFQQFKKHFGVK